MAAMITNTPPHPANGLPIKLNDVLLPQTEQSFNNKVLPRIDAPGFSHLSSEEWANVKHLVESQPKNSKADAIISCAGGVIDLEDKKLECALRRGNRIEDDGWLQWEKKHALEIGIDFHADSDEDLIMVKK